MGGKGKIRDILVVYMIPYMAVGIYTLQEKLDGILKSILKKFAKPIDNCDSTM